MLMLSESNVFDFILKSVTDYKTARVPLAENWDWNMWQHIQRTVLYKNSKFLEGPNDGNRPFKNIVRPILNVAYRTEGFDVKDITPFVDNEDEYHKSFLVKKYHRKWANRNGMDTFIDETVESIVDFGLGLVKDVGQTRPECVPLQSIAFCDQTDILAGPIGILHPMTPDELDAMRGKWDEDRINEAILMAKNEKATLPQGGTKAKTPGKHIDVYELHGVMPESWVDDASSPDRYVRQAHYVTFYTLENGTKQGISLFKGRERRQIFKAHKRDPIYGRACGFGGVEELFEPQQWTNYSEIQLKEMLDAAALSILQTADPTIAGRNRVDDLDKNEILLYDTAYGGLSKVDTVPRGFDKFEANLQRWEANAMTIGSASEGSLGKSPASGTPFALQNLIVQEGNGMHDYRRGKHASFAGEIWRDWVLPHLVRDINQGQKFLDELSVDEMQEVVERVVNNLANQKIKAKLLTGEVPTDEEMDLFREVTKSQFIKGGQKRFMELLKDEIRDIPVDVEVNVAGKQEYLNDRVVKLTNVFRQIIANPAILQIPGMAKLFNDIIESAGLSPINFAGITKEQLQALQPAPAAPAAIEPPVAETTSPNA